VRTSISIDECIFDGALIRAARHIRELYPSVDFDCRATLLSEIEPDYEWKMTEQFRAGYMAFKYAVAKVLQPKRICEIGVCSGVGALAFLAACPDAEYLGIDISDGRLVQRASELLIERGYGATIEIADSQKLAELRYGPYDLVHVDGDHHRECAKHDVILAWNSLAPSGYILVDDSRDNAVAAGVFDALVELRPGSTDWAYFEDTWTGSILIGKEKSRP
jgi:predicted O-methyltransferase YrrM